MIRRIAPVLMPEGPDEPSRNVHSSQDIRLRARLICDAEMGLNYRAQA